MKNDQWFEPGDKVMRVCDSRIEGEDDDFSASLAFSPFGVVHCVSRFCEPDISQGDDPMNLVEIVGYPVVTDENYEYWEAASDFRKVEEIQLCIEAAEMVKNPNKEQQSA